ncbi:hypothetical protein [Listeria monocytogenes]|nr:hypothetical protein [Listeria monocytogenes]KSZ47223.1 hypothetical protein AOA13_2182c [Listeria monocytogenes]MCF2043374.1 hypothetical protein [Listeria monocytogenes]MCF2073396.1 hypothetical protein [Listeria monocytogenes]MDA5742585.1 hypothetical protein [Listeria monocytogenes]MDA5848010.1 hypothetical protein [Listeria monocytogenes]
MDAQGLAKLGRTGMSASELANRLTRGTSELLKGIEKRNGMRAMNFEHMIGRDTEKGIIITDPKEELKHAASHKSDHIRKKRQETRVQHPSGRK